MSSWDGGQFESQVLQWNTKAPDFSSASNSSPLNVTVCCGRSDIRFQNPCGCSWASCRFGDLPLRSFDQPCQYLMVAQACVFPCSGSANGCGTIRRNPQTGKFQSHQPAPKKKTPIMNVIVPFVPSSKTSFAGCREHLPGPTVAADGSLQRFCSLPFKPTPTSGD